MPDHPSYAHDAPKIGYANVPCDATLCTDHAGVAGRVTTSHHTSAPQTSVPVGACSADRVEVWHGMDTPAHACGKHATYLNVAVFRGHRNRIAASESAPS